MGVRDDWPANIQMFNIWWEEEMFLGTIHKLKLLGGSHYSEAVTLLLHPPCADEVGISTRPFLQQQSTNLATSRLFVDLLSSRHSPKIAAQCDLDFVGRTLTILLEVSHSNLDTISPKLVYLVKVVCLARRKVQTNSMGKSNP
ncbi:uncharacterized protein LOC131149646 isoform X2 [Malania oleifera]|uniref:uncharacterized protein LOC131149646 isoform X2 n=1 Tax=Malania oleifera TaxID=397392 RepID=UPI0025ADF177|nr:uncharacterized protein LOC131149646 isoform X2 [Malania oleifera]